MIRGLGRMTAAMLAVMLALGTAASAEGSRGILYRTQKGEATVYLLGSIHVGNEEMHPFGEGITAAMEASDMFVFECDSTSVDALQAALKWMVYTDGTRIRDVISPELYERLTAACRKAGYPERAFDSMRPWAAMSQLSMQAAGIQMGVADVQKTVSLGVEAAVTAFATAKEREIGYLEAIDDQLQLFDRMTMPLQTYLLNETITAILDPEALEGMDATMKDWPGWWRDGNIDAFVEGYRSSYLSDSLPADILPLLQEYHVTLVSNRNRSMADAVESYLNAETPRTYFVTVGLLHLVLPEDSVVTHLRERGYPVECLSTP